MTATPEELVQAAEDAYNAKDRERVLALFTPDIVFYKNGRLMAKGIDDLARWHDKFFAATKDHRIRKTLRAATGATIAVEVTDTWVSAHNGEEMQGFGGEFWTLEDDRLTEWHFYYRSYVRC